MKKQQVARLPIYLDNAASTPMHPEVIAAMTACLSCGGIFGNSASKDHIYGWQAAEAVEKARSLIADSVGCSILELIFTSGATESNNLAVQGLARSLKASGDQRRRIITSAAEHKAVLECCELLEDEGFHTEYLKPDAEGIISPAMLEEALDSDTFLVSLGHANSVLGSVNDIKALSAVAKSKGAFFHSDCAQSNGILNLDLSLTDVSFATLTPEKIYGPKGIGALYIKRDLPVKLRPLIVGGGHEKGLRGGTLATHQIVAMGEAFALMHKHREKNAAYISSLRRRLEQGLSEIEGCIINGSHMHRVPGILSVSFSNIDGRMLLPSLSTKIACSAGSACSSEELKPSYVLLSTGMSEDLARASIRLSVGLFNTEEEIDNAVAAVKSAVKVLRIK